MKVQGMVTILVRVPEAGEQLSAFGFLGCCGVLPEFFAHPALHFFQLVHIQGLATIRIQQLEFSCDVSEFDVV